MTTVVADLVYQRGLPTRFASCPPALGLLLDLRKTRQKPTLRVLVKRGKSFNTNPLVAMGVACLPQRSQGGGRRPEGMSGGRRAVSVADSESSSGMTRKLKNLGIDTKVFQFNDFVNCSYLNIKIQK